MAGVGTTPETDQMYRLTYDGRSPTNAVSSPWAGGRSRSRRPGEQWREGMNLSEALVLAVSLLGADPAGGPDRSSAGPARGGRARPAPAAATFRRITGQLLERLLSRTTPPATPRPPTTAPTPSVRDASTNPQTQRPAQDGRDRVNTPGGRRIFGIENEYGITCSTGGQRTLTPDEVARYLFRKVVAWGRSSNVFLTNGSRLYLDVGSHPEYATAECDTLRQVVAHDKAGERIIEGLVVDAQQRLREDGVAGDIYVFKNNTDSAGNSYGCHENYLVTRAGEFATISDTLLPVPDQPPDHLRRRQAGAPRPRAPRTP